MFAIFAPTMTFQCFETANVTATCIVYDLSFPLSKLFSADKICVTPFCVPQKNIVTLFCAPKISVTPFLFTFSEKPQS